MKHDDALLYDVAALVAGALSEVETAELEAHVAGCARCGAEFLALSDALGAAVADAAPVPPAFSAERAAALRNRIMEAIAPEPPLLSGRPAIAARDALVPLAPGIDWAVVAERGITLIYWVFTPPECGRVGPEAHTQTQSGYIISGAMKLYYTDGTEVLQSAGSFYLVPPGTVHTAEFLERTVIIDTYAPNNVEFERRYREEAARLGVAADAYRAR